MSPASDMSTMSFSSSNSSITILKLNDNASNWMDYKFKALTGMGSKGLARHVDGTARRPTSYQEVNGVLMLSDGTTPATEQQIEEKEDKLEEFEKREYLAQHIITSTVSVRL